MVVFENVLSHTSTQKSPKYLNLHNLSAEFCLGVIFICQNELGLETGWQKLSGHGFASFCGLMWFSKQWPKGPSPQGVLFGACGSDLPRYCAICWCLITLFLKQASDVSPCHTLQAMCNSLCFSGPWQFVWMYLNLQVCTVFALV